MNAQPKNIFAVVLARVRAAVDVLAAEGALPGGLDVSRILVEPPREAAHGDMATNAAMVLAKPAGKKPRELAEAIAAKLRGEKLIEDVAVAGPGFINLTLTRAAWIEELRGVLGAGRDSGRGDSGRGEPINVEYVSTNPTGPIHVGHGRGAVFGDALANLLAFTGHQVTREYYVNDAGAQVDVLARSAFPRGARRKDRPGSRGPLSRRLSQAGRRSARPRVWSQPQGQARIRMVADGARARDRRHAGPHQGRSRPAQRAARGVLLRAIARRGYKECGRSNDRVTARQGSDLRGTAAAAQGPADRRLGGPGADAVPRHPIRRRRGPAADEVGRQLHLFRLRHRVSQIQIRPRLPQHDRRVGRRPRRLRQAHAGGGEGDQRRQGRPGREARATGAAPARRRTRENVETRRGTRHLGGGGRRGRAGRGALHAALPQERCATRFRPCQGDRTVARQPGVLRAVRPRARAVGIP